MPTLQERIQSAGIVWPEPSPAAGNYLPFVEADGWIHVSGQLPMVSGQLVATGKVGADVSLDEAYQAARVCAINGLALIRQALGGSDEALERVRIVRVGGFVASAAGFTAQPRVINGASDLLVEILGEAGRHARAAVGVAELPLGAAVEVEFLARVR
ncbi:MAG: RidA family protein [bacterium]|nr:RidA family protein [bacterium]